MKRIGGRTLAQVAWDDDSDSCQITEVIRQTPAASGASDRSICVQPEAGTTAPLLHPNPAWPGAQPAPGRQPVADVDAGQRLLKPPRSACNPASRWAVSGRQLAVA